MRIELPAPDCTVPQFFNAYLATAGRDLRGLHRVQWICDHWSKRFPDVVVSAIRKRDLSLYIEERRLAGKSNGTINREISVLSAAINYAVKRWDWNILNPARGLLLKQPEGRLRWLTYRESLQLLKAAREGDAPHLEDFIRIALNTGMRRNEILTLELSRIDLEARKIHLSGNLTKSGRRRILPINRQTREAIASRMAWNESMGLTHSRLFLQRNGKPVVQINTAFKNATQRAGIEDFRIHDLRHTFASWLVSSGVPLPEVRDLLGHSSIKQTERYAHLAPGRLEAAVSVLDEMTCT